MALTNGRMVGLKSYSGPNRLILVNMIKDAR